MSLSFSNYAEGGDEIIASRLFNIELKDVGANYRVPFNFKSRIEPGESGRLALKIGASKSSYHRLRLVLYTTDGERMNSRWVRLHYFAPRVVVTDWDGDGEFKVMEP